MDRLKTIAIVIPNADLVLSSIVGTYKLFLEAVKETEAETEVLILGSEKQKGFFKEVFTLQTHGQFLEYENLDLIIVPAIKSDIDIAMADNQDLIRWLRERYEQGSHIASLCSGAFLLAASGMLDQKDCTCHWAQADYFQELFPKTHFLRNEIITECEGIFTSGGAFSFLNLIIYLIERFYNPDLARKLYRMYEIDYSRKSQAAFAMFDAKKNHGDSAIVKAQIYIETHYSEGISIASIAKHVQLGERTLSRRFKEQTNHTVNQYLQRIRIETAKSLLVETKKNINEIQYEVGFNDPKSFRSIFLRMTRTTPSAYRRQYQSIK